MRSLRPQAWPSHKQPSRSRLEWPQPDRLHKALPQREHRPQELRQPEHRQLELLQPELRRLVLRVKPNFSRMECGPPGRYCKSTHNKYINVPCPASARISPGQLVKSGRRAPQPPGLNRLRKNSPANSSQTDEIKFCCTTAPAAGSTAAGSTLSVSTTAAKMNHASVNFCVRNTWTDLAVL
jgi:hypothetical protein